MQDWEHSLQACPSERGGKQLYACGAYTSKLYHFPLQLHLSGHRWGQLEHSGYVDWRLWLCSQLLPTGWNVHHWQSRLPAAPVAASTYRPVDTHQSHGCCVGAASAIAFHQPIYSPSLL